MYFYMYYEAMHFHHNFFWWNYITLMTFYTAKLCYLMQYRFLHNCYQATKSTPKHVQWLSWLKFKEYPTSASLPEKKLQRLLHICTCSGSQWEEEKTHQLNQSFNIRASYMALVSLQIFRCHSTETLVVGHHHWMSSYLVSAAFKERFLIPGLRV